MSGAKVVREKIVWPFEGKERKVLLHACCAVCTGAIVEAMCDSGINPTLCFYNPNIYPSGEYERRKRGVISFARKKGVAVIDDDYAPEAWFRHVQGHEDEREGGERCRKCFELRLRAAARCARENGFQVFTSTLGISRYKNFDVITAIGKEIACCSGGLVYWDHNWRKKGGSERMHAIAKEENFYAQDYCGCIFSFKAKHPCCQAKDQTP